MHNLRLLREFAVKRISSFFISSLFTKQARGMRNSRKEAGTGMNVNEDTNLRRGHILSKTNRIMISQGNC